MPPEAIAAATIITIVAGTIGLAEFFWKPIRRHLLRRPEPRAATQEQVEEVQRTLEEVKEKLARPAEGATDIGTGELAKAAGPDTEARLREALELQAQHKEREAIDALYEAFRKDLEPRAKVELHILLGVGFFHLSAFVEAEGHFRQVVDISRHARFREGEAAALGNLGNVYIERGDLDQTEEYYSQALAIYRETGNHRGEAGALGNLGIVYRRRGDLARAEEHYEQALAIDREIENRHGEAQDTGNLGNIYYQRGDLKRAEEHHQKALAIDREIENRLGEAQDLGNLGNVYLERGDLDQAQEHYGQSLDIHREIRNRIDEANQLANLGFVAAQRDQQEEACRLLKEAAAIFEKIGAGGPGPDRVRTELQEFGCE